MDKMAFFLAVLAAGIFADLLAGIFLGVVVIIYYLFFVNKNDSQIGKDSENSGANSITDIPPNRNN